MIDRETTGKRGAPRGNQNARKHGFYSRVLDEAEQRDFALATEVDGLDDEIALLRVKIKSIVAHDPENLGLIMQATDALARLLRTKYNIGKKDRNEPDGGGGQRTQGHRPAPRRWHRDEPSAGSKRCRNQRNPASTGSAPTSSEVAWPYSRASSAERASPSPWR